MVKCPLVNITDISRTQVCHPGVGGQSHDIFTVALSAGHLVLSLDKDSFEVLGVEGKPSRFNHKTKCRFGLSGDITMTSSVFAWLMLESVSE